MDINRAKKILKVYIADKIEADFDILGEEETLPDCDCLVKEVREAYLLLKDNYQFFTVSEKA